MNVKTLIEWEFSWRIALHDALITNTLLAVITLLLVSNLRYYRPKKAKWLYLFVVCAAACALFVCSVKYILLHIFAGDASYTQWLLKSLPVRLDIAFLVIMSMVMLSELWYKLEEQKEKEFRQ